MAGSLDDTLGSDPEHQDRPHRWLGSSILHRAVLVPKSRMKPGPTHIGYRRAAGAIAPAHEYEKPQPFRDQPGLSQGSNPKRPAPGVPGPYARSIARLAVHHSDEHLSGPRIRRLKDGHMKSPGQIGWPGLRTSCRRSILPNAQRVSTGERRPASLKSRSPRPDCGRPIGAEPSRKVSFSAHQDRHGGVRQLLAL
jgi:hypothetical protein